MFAAIESSLTNTWIKTFTRVDCLTKQQKLKSFTGINERMQQQQQQQPIQQGQQIPIPIPITSHPQITQLSNQPINASYTPIQYATPSTSSYPSNFYTAPPLQYNNGQLTQQNFMNTPPPPPPPPKMQQLQQFRQLTQPQPNQQYRNPIPSPSPTAPQPQPQPQTQRRASSTPKPNTKRKTPAPKPSPKPSPKPKEQEEKDEYDPYAGLSKASRKKLRKRESDIEAKEQAYQEYLKRKKENENGVITVLVKPDEETVRAEDKEMDLLKKKREVEDGEVDEGEIDDEKVDGVEKDDVQEKENLNEVVQKASNQTPTPTETPPQQTIQHTIDVQESPKTKNNTHNNNNEDPLTNTCSQILTLLNKNPSSPQYQNTASRYAHLLQSLTTKTPYTINTYPNNSTNKQIIFIPNINIQSLCQNTLFPFTGKVSLGYIPNKKLIDVSCISNVISNISRDLHDQHCLTEKICTALQEAIEPLGLGVVLNCYHSSLMLQNLNGFCRTSCLKGCFSEDLVKKDFFNLVKE